MEEQGIVCLKCGSAERIHCADCGGWKIKNGALFFPVILEPECYGWICELCCLKRLLKRGLIHDALSSPCVHVGQKLLEVLQGRVEDIESAVTDQEKERARQWQIAKYANQ